MNRFPYRATIFSPRSLCIGFIFAAGLLAGSAENKSFSFFSSVNAYESNSGINRTAQEQELERIQREIQSFLPDVEALREKRDDLSQEKKILQDRFIANAERVRFYENSVAKSESGIQRLNIRETELVAGLRAETGKTNAALTAMARLTLAPSGPAGATEGAMETVQTSILLRGLSEELKIRADRLRNDIKQLNETRNALTEQRKNLDSEREKLTEEEKQLTLLIEKREEELTKNHLGLSASEKRLQELTSKAQTVEALLQGIQRYEESEKDNLWRDQLTKIRDLENKAGEIARGSADSNLRNQAAQTAQKAADIANAARLLRDQSDDSGFDAERVQVGYPVAGKMICSYGSTAPGCQKEAVTFAASRPRAWVTSPVAGEVVFADHRDFRRGYGKIVIIQVSDSYTMIISGMESLNVRHGQRVAAGEPLGRANGYANAKISMEVRKKLQVINPTAWLKNAGYATAKN